MKCVKARAVKARAVNATPVPEGLAELRGALGDAIHSRTVQSVARIMQRYHDGAFVDEYTLACVMSEAIAYERKLMEQATRMLHALSN